MLFKHEFERYVYVKFTATIREMSLGLRRGIYALCIHRRTFWSHVEPRGPFEKPDDYRSREIIFQSVISLSYKTSSEWEARYDDDKMKWLSQWLYRDGLGVIPQIPPFGEEPDPYEMALRDQWCASLGIKAIGTDETGRPLYGEDFEVAVRGLGQRTIQLMHESGFIVEQFGTSIPIAILTEEGVEEVEATIRANPPDTLNELRQYSPCFNRALVKRNEAGGG